MTTENEALLAARSFIERVEAEAKAGGNASRASEAREALNMIGEVDPRETTPAKTIVLGGLTFQMLPAEISAFRRFCHAVDDVHDYGVPAGMMQRLACIGLVREVANGAYITTDFGVALWQSGKPPIAADWAIAPDHPYRRLTELKTKSVMQSDYRITGYVLRDADGAKVCISEGSAVRWLSAAELFDLMHSNSHSTPTNEQLLAAFNSAETVLDGLHEVLGLVGRTGA